MARSWSQVAGCPTGACLPPPGRSTPPPGRWSRPPTLCRAGSSTGWRSWTGGWWWLEDRPTTRTLTASRSWMRLAELGRILGSTLKQLEMTTRYSSCQELLRTIVDWVFMSTEMLLRYYICYDLSFCYYTNGLVMEMKLFHTHIVRASESR